MTEDANDLEACASGGYPPPGTRLTPMFEQYLSIKAEYPDALLFYRMGDFYEMFFDDAEIAARELQITLTCRNPNADVRVPMCGVPHHSAEAYLTQLLDKGFKIAICDQIEDPKLAKGLVKRAVTRVLTPGTVVEDSSLQAKEHNYLGAYFWDEAAGAGGLAWLDYSTGEWSGLHSRKEFDLLQWALKIEPRELLLPEGASRDLRLSELRARLNTVPPRAFFDLRASEEKLLRTQRVTDLRTLDLENKPQLVQALGAIITYLFQTQKTDLRHLVQFRPINLNKHLLLDEVTERNLEIFRRLDGGKGKGTLIGVLDQTRTPMGGRLLDDRLRRPWRDAARIALSADAVEHFFRDDERRAALRRALNEVWDLERLSTRIFLNRAMPKDFTALRQSLAALPAIRDVLASDGEAPSAVRSILESWDGLDDLAGLLERALVDAPPPVITEGGLFRVGYDPALDELIELAEHGEGKIRELLESERVRSNLPKLKMGYNRVFGYYFELSRAADVHAPAHFVRRQTLANAERYVTDELKEMEDRLLSASDRRKALEHSLFTTLRETLANARHRFMDMAGRLAALDFWQGLAETARKWDWRRPVINTGLETRIMAGRHPAVEAVQGADNFIANDLYLDTERRVLLITGPNMAGKSTVLRQTAIIFILAQIGSFVPAREAQIGIADRVFTRVGASDNLAQGRSTFMVEMVETARILRQATPRSLVVLDEIGRGTSTFDGLALAWAVVEELSGRGAGGVRTIFATHYHELTALEGKIPAVRNFNIAVREWKGDIVFLRRLVPGPADRSYGIEVARLAGVPQNVVNRAREILQELESRSKTARQGDPPPNYPTAAQAMLPGLLEVRAGVEKAPQAPAPHPLLQELWDLTLDNLTPIGALNLLQSWKSRYGKEESE